MPHYRIKGARADTGDEVDLVVEAADYPTIQQFTRDKGIFTESITVERDPPPLPVHVRRSPPPELVWYGQMYCHSCGYQWKARRNTPPAKCAGCGRKNIEAVRVPKAGCLSAVALIFSAGAALAYVATRLITA